ncbi:class I SAM-dependent methyltransferase [Pedobacter cryophilus]|uniref:SAM-dependent methyltransferase n=1 Tax=Pedobacter cryophilus TaxID=2571271 RepID=A0A4U1BYY1_9SPHI|nr:SAM-dependent methyltransferase [Pedobacter cryophilus]TKB96696.1 SAM-dependent methyltransferase [Pedobacter cryophilus]
MSVLDADYWNNRYLNGQAGWDLGEISTPLKAYINQLQKKDFAILIPGAGNAHEAVYLLENGFKNVTVIDFAQKALDNLRLKLTSFDSQHFHLIQDDFFNHHGEYDLMMEQTFFCAIDPFRRTDYVKHAHQLLAKDGKIVGLMFNKIFPFEGPPFGGSKEEYEQLFQAHFKIELMEEAHNSVLPRQGSELFVKLIKK